MAVVGKMTKKQRTDDHKYSSTEAATISNSSSMSIIRDSSDEIIHKPSTKNWNELTKKKEMLPIKIKGKVIKKMKTVENVKRRIEEEEAEDDDAEDENEDSENENGQGADAYDDQDNEFMMPEMPNFDTIDLHSQLHGEDNDDEERGEKLQKQPSKKTSKEQESPQPSSHPQKSRFDSLTYEKKKLLIAEICHAILQDPMKAFKKRRSTEINSQMNTSRNDAVDGIDVDDIDYRITDIFLFLHDPNSSIQELAMLSCYLLFKDICPSYKIRKQDQSDTSIQHKKDIKRLRDYDLSILSNYNYYLKYLSNQVETGLGSIKRTDPMTDREGRILTSWQLGVSALRLQCELLKSLSHFNYRSNLLISIIRRAGQFLNSISHLCSVTLENILINDVDSEITYEIIQTIGSYLTQMKYNVHENLLVVLNSSKLRVHSSLSKEIHKKVKQNKRKRKRDVEDIEANLQETDASSQALLTKRYQADALHEVCIIYFRVIKLKVGYRLLPTALHGLSRIIHLINIEMVEDLVTLLKGLIQPINSTLPIELKLLCIHCALISLSGPGQELGIDDEFFIVQLRSVIVELPHNYSHWDKVYSCIEICFLKHRDVRNSLILSFVSLLLHLSCQITSIPQSLTALTLAHSILLRYPRTREQMTFLQSKTGPPAHTSHTGITGITGIGGTGHGNMAAASSSSASSTAPVIPSYISPQLDDEVGDLAMIALRKESRNNTTNVGLQPGSGDESDWNDGSWMAPLLSAHIGNHYRHIIKSLTSRNITPIPLRINEMTHDKELFFYVKEFEKIFQELPTTKKISCNSHNNGPEKKSKKNGKKGKDGKDSQKTNEKKASTHNNNNQKNQKKNNNQKKMSQSRERGRGKGGRGRA